MTKVLNITEEKEIGGKSEPTELSIFFGDKIISFEFKSDFVFKNNFYLLYFRHIFSSFSV